MTGIAPRRGIQSLPRLRPCSPPAALIPADGGPHGCPRCLPMPRRRPHFHTARQVRALVDRGAQVLFEVDATCLSQYPEPLPGPFDFIIFNFPHTGEAQHGVSHEQVKRSIQSNQAMLSAFFAEALPLLRPKGQVHVTLKNCYPYSEWQLEALARQAGLHLQAILPFEKADWPGYSHKRTAGGRKKAKVSMTGPLTYCFGREAPGRPVDRSFVQGPQEEHAPEALAQVRAYNAVHLTVGTSAVMPAPAASTSNPYARRGPPAMVGLDASTAAAAESPAKVRAYNAVHLQIVPTAAVLPAPAASTSNPYARRGPPAMVGLDASTAVATESAAKVRAYNAVHLQNVPTAAVLPAPAASTSNPYARRGPPAMVGLDASTAVATEFPAKVRAYNAVHLQNVPTAAVLPAPAASTSNPYARRGPPAMVGLDASTAVATESAAKVRAYNTVHLQNVPTAAVLVAPAASINNPCARKRSRLP